MALCPWPSAWSATALPARASTLHHLISFSRPFSISHSTHGDASPA